MRSSYTDFGNSAYGVREVSKIVSEKGVSTLANVNGEFSISIVGTVPTAGQSLVATGGTSASWKNIASETLVNTAQSTADTALSTAETAKSTAETAKSTADTAKSTADDLSNSIVNYNSVSNDELDANGVGPVVFTTTPEVPGKYVVDVNASYRYDKPELMKVVTDRVNAVNAVITGLDNFPATFTYTDTTWNSPNLIGTVHHFNGDLTINQNVKVVNDSSQPNNNICIIRCTGLLTIADNVIIDSDEFDFGQLSDTGNSRIFWVSNGCVIGSGVKMLGRIFSRDGSGSGNMTCGTNCILGPFYAQSGSISPSSALFHRAIIEYVHSTIHNHLYTLINLSAITNGKITSTVGCQWGGNVMSKTFDYSGFDAQPITPGYTLYTLAHIESTIGTPTFGVYKNGALITNSNRSRTMPYGTRGTDEVSIRTIVDVLQNDVVEFKAIPGGGVGLVMLGRCVTFSRIG
jgi:hypothetical protein